MNSFGLIKINITIIFFIIQMQHIFSKTNIGINGGMGFSNEKNSLLYFDKKISNEFNIYQYIPSHNLFDYRINLGYKNRGYQTEFPIPETIRNINYHLLTFGPDMLYQPFNNGLQIYVFSGLDVEYLLYQSGLKEFLFNEEYINSLRKLQYSIDIGIGYNIDHKLYFEIIGNRSILNKIKSDNSYKPQAHDIYIGLRIGHNI